LKGTEAIAPILARKSPSSSSESLSGNSSSTNSHYKLNNNIKNQIMRALYRHHANDPKSFRHPQRSVVYQWNDDGF
jgi:hypothetical protein